MDNYRIVIGSLLTFCHSQKGNRLVTTPTAGEHAHLLRLRLFQLTSDKSGLGFPLTNSGFNNCFSLNSPAQVCREMSQMENNDINTNQRVNHVIYSLI